MSNGNRICPYFSNKLKKCSLNKEWGLCREGESDGGYEIYLYPALWVQCSWFKQEEAKNSNDR